jgi:hypothetical protein
VESGVSERKASQDVDRPLRLRAGDWVEVKGSEQILATLDSRQCVSGLPFMPEMLQYCGKRFRVFKTAHKTADVIEAFSIRRMENTVHLEGLRCDGESHGGCQAGCLLFWKECWLTRVDANKPTDKDSASGEYTTASATARAVLDSATRAPRADGQPEKYQCQATELLNATTRVLRRERFDPRFYVKDLTSGNVKFFDFVRFGALATINAFQRRWFGRWYPSVVGLAGDTTPTLDLNLQPGELVRVLPKDAVMRTLNSKAQNRGMWFDCEMVLYCDNGNYRVLRRVERLINEKTGQMIKLKNPCIILDGVTCSGNYLYQRMFSPRNDYMFFREIWLKRVKNAGQKSPN